MLLFSPDGQAFVTGAARFIYAPAIPDLDKSPRIRIPIIIEGFKTSAVLDTGAPYIVCPPDIANQVGLTPENAIDELSLLVHNSRVPGHLYRLNVTFIAEFGESLDLDTTVYVPQDWQGKPAYIGLTACLDSVRFAIDPQRDQEAFYFGKTFNDDY